VVKPLHTCFSGTAHAVSGPNDGSVIQPKFSSEMGITVGCGIHPPLADIDPFLMAQASVDEAVRNVLCTGAEYGHPESVLGIAENIVGPDPSQDVHQGGWLVRTYYGLKDAALGLSIPILSGQDTIKAGAPNLLVTALARVPDVKGARSADFKTVGDCIYLLGHSDFGLLGTAFENVILKKSGEKGLSAGSPVWEVARKIYSWIGGGVGKHQDRLKSLHDVSEGGILVAVAESLVARGLGATLAIPKDRDFWEFAFGEGFHAFITSFAESDTGSLEAEWNAAGVPFIKLGQVESTERLEVFHTYHYPCLNISVKQLQSAWKKEGYWE
jgi:phosphoribosylformylglycinamidine (FGAM) synthase-like enzyme